MAPARSLAPAPTPVKTPQLNSQPSPPVALSSFRVVPSIPHCHSRRKCLAVATVGGNGNQPSSFVPPCCFWEDTLASGDQYYGLDQGIAQSPRFQSLRVWISQVHRIWILVAQSGTMLESPLSHMTLLLFHSWTLTEKWLYKLFLHSTDIRRLYVSRYMVY